MRRFRTVGKGPKLDGTERSCTGCETYGFTFCYRVRDPSLDFVVRFIEVYECRVHHPSQPNTPKPHIEFQTFNTKTTSWRATSPLTTYPTQPVNHEYLNHRTTSHTPPITEPPTPPQNKPYKPSAETAPPPPNEHLPHSTNTPFHATPPSLPHPTRPPSLGLLSSPRPRNISLGRPNRIHTTELVSPSVIPQTGVHAVPKLSIFKCMLFGVCIPLDNSRSARLLSSMRETKRLSAVNSIDFSMSRSVRRRVTCAFLSSGAWWCWWCYNRR